MSHDLVEMKEAISRGWDDEAAAKNLPKVIVLGD
jgi:hypothetical protein